MHASSSEPISFGTVKVGFVSATVGATVGSGTTAGAVAEATAGAVAAVPNWVALALLLAQTALAAEGNGFAAEVIFGGGFAIIGVDEATGFESNCN